MTEASAEAGADAGLVDAGARSARMTVVGDLSLWSEGSLLSIASRGSLLSIGSVGSVLSVGSVGSALSVGSIGSILSAFSACSSLCVGSAMSVRSRWSTMSAGGDREVMGRRRRPPLAAVAVGTVAVAGAVGLLAIGRHRG